MGWRGWPAWVPLRAWRDTGRCPTTGSTLQPALRLELTLEPLRRLLQRQEEAPITMACRCQTQATPTPHPIVNPPTPSHPTSRMPSPLPTTPPPTRKSTTGTFGITTRFMQHKRFGLKKCLSRLCKALTEILNLFTFIDSINLLKSLYCVVTVCSLQGISVGLWSCF